MIYLLTPKVNILLYPHLLLPRCPLKNEDSIQAEVRPMSHDGQTEVFFSSVLMQPVIIGSYF